MRHYFNIDDLSIIIVKLILDGFGCLTLIYSNIKFEIEVIDGLYQKIFKLEILTISVHMYVAPNGFKSISIFKKEIDSFRGGNSPSAKAIEWRFAVFLI